MKPIRPWGVTLASTPSGVGGTGGLSVIEASEAFSDHSYEQRTSPQLQQHDDSKDVSVTSDADDDGSEDRAGGEAERGRGRGRGRPKRRTIEPKR